MLPSDASHDDVVNRTFLLYITIQQNQAGVFFYGQQAGWYIRFRVWRAISSE